MFLGAEPNSRSSTPSRTHTGSMSVLPRPRHAGRAGPAISCLADRRTVRSIRRDSGADRFRRATTGTPCSTFRGRTRRPRRLDPVTTIVIVANQELATASAAGLTESFGGVSHDRWGRGEPVRSPGRNRARRYRARRRRRRRDTFPSDYRLALQALNQGRRWRSKRQRSRVVVQDIRRGAGRQQARPEAKPATLAGLFGRLTQPNRA